MANKIKFLDLTKQYESIKKEISTAIKKVFESGVFIGGEKVEELEKEIANFCGTKYAIGVNSGTDALFLSLKSLGIGTGDEIITTPFTFIATAEVITACGAKPVFVDINLQAFNINPKEIEEKITKNTKAIIPVHLFGQMADMPEITKIARKYKLFVIEDTAQAIGAKLKVEGRKLKVAGSIGDIGCLSFFPTKNLGAYGDGGMILTNNKKLADKIRLLKNHGSSSKEKYLNIVPGVNSRLDTLQAAILRVKLKHLKNWTIERQKIAEYYNQKLSKVGDIVTPEILVDRTHIFHQYTITTKYREKLQNYLKEKGIPAMIYYPLPLHLQPAFKYLGYKKGDFPKAEKAAKEVLSLPIYPELSGKNQDFIIKTIKKFYERQN